MKNQINSIIKSLLQSFGGVIAIALFVGMAGNAAGQTEGVCTQGDHMGVNPHTNPPVTCDAGERVIGNLLSMGCGTCFDGTCTPSSAYTIGSVDFCGTPCLLTHERVENSFECRPRAESDCTNPAFPRFVPDASGEGGQCGCPQGQGLEYNDNTDSNECVACDPGEVSDGRTACAAAPTCDAADNQVLNMAGDACVCAQHHADPDTTDSMLMCVLSCDAADNQEDNAAGDACVCMSGFADSDTTDSELVCEMIPTCDTANNQAVDQTMNECACAPGFTDPDEADGVLECVLACNVADNQVPNTSGDGCDCVSGYEDRDTADSVLECIPDCNAADNQVLNAAGDACMCMDEFEDFNSPAGSLNCIAVCDAPLQRQLDGSCGPCHPENELYVRYECRAATIRTKTIEGLGDLVVVLTLKEVHGITEVVGTATIVGNRIIPYPYNPPDETSMTTGAPTTPAVSMTTAMSMTVDMPTTPAVSMTTAMSMTVDMPTTPAMSMTTAMSMTAAVSMTTGSSLSRAADEINAGPESLVGAAVAELGNQTGEIAAGFAPQAPQEASSSRDASEYVAPAAIIGAAAFAGFYSGYSLIPSLDFFGENDDVSYRAGLNAEFHEGSFRSFVRASHSDSDSWITMESGTDYRGGVFSAGYKALETKERLEYEFQAASPMEFGLWTLSPAASAEFQYQREGNEGWSSESSAGLTAAWTAHRWRVKASSNFVGAGVHALDLELQL